MKPTPLAPWRLGFYDTEALELWTQGARAGEQATYFLGLLSEMRVDDDIPQHDRGRINQVADAALELERRGLIALVRERVSADAFRYIAVRSAKTFRVVRSYAEAA